MSRKFEALQKANPERTSAQDSYTDVPADPIAALHLEDPLPPRAKFKLEQVAKHSWNPSMVSLPVLEEWGAAVEQFRRLRSQLYQLRDEAPLKTILISSGMPEDGKSFVAANLAMSLAHKSVNNILLIDGDLRRPTLHDVLGAPNAPGLSDYLAGTADLSEIIQSNGNPRAGEGATSIGNLSFIPAGKCSANSSELVAHHRLQDLIETLSSHFDWILIDSPPALVVTDAVDLARNADAVLLVARGARTPFDVAQRTQAAFSKRRILGFVLNGVADAPGSGNYYYAGRQQGSGESTKRKAKRGQDDTDLKCLLSDPGRGGISLRDSARMRSIGGRY